MDRLAPRFIRTSMLFSVLMAMSLTPALCATLLKPVEKGHKHERGGFFGWFNRTFALSTTKYQSIVARILKAGSVSGINLESILIATVGAIAVIFVARFASGQRGFSRG